MITANYVGGLQETDTVELTTTNATAVHTATDNQEILTGFSIANIHTSAVLVTCYLNKGSDVVVFVKLMAATSTHVETEMPLRLREDYIFKATAATANMITITPIVTRFDNNVPTNN
tara:strand:- start:437 stop:787 length:351 start_codon:yes stop_codon:yes gene_type:complete